MTRYFQFINRKGIPFDVDELWSWDEDTRQAKWWNRESTGWVFDCLSGAKIEQFNIPVELREVFNVFRSSDPDLYMDEGL